MKTIIFDRFKIFSLLSVSITLSIVLLMVRMKLTHSFFYLFLIWNLFLAVIPFAITTYLVSTPKLNKIGFAIWCSVWLLFLPNAPYIITDLLHLKIGSNHLLWLDVLVVISFALNGLLMFSLSLLDMETLLNQYLKRKTTNFIMIFILFLSGFGVYLGRFLRYNSWEILQHPSDLFNDIFNIIIQPNQHLEAWLFTFIFGLFLSIGFWVFKVLYTLKNS
ncbi:DUF1361 domain-containing protein [Flavivirga spongiicola]|uniref:DUF1361 domain-containing protein n=1 Tax=Flavivirga spongiicola TaxID=421621 RepID=A0ABU7XWE0_9FLAO|nr:DUF1361 domain-containing protein [Flavivirga sp. MEBiC05379]MDO5980094.1 DUF1361 domain-containing protein [Flavivirga sp. MEBiC05379]